MRSWLSRIWSPHVLVAICQALVADSTNKGNVPSQGVQNLQSSFNLCHTARQGSTLSSIWSIGSKSLEPTDFWSAALLETIDTLKPTMGVYQITSKTITQLLDEPGAFDKPYHLYTAFQRGLDHLRNVKGPLRDFKLALDFVSPLLSFELQAPSQAAKYRIARMTV